MNIRLRRIIILILFLIGNCHLTWAQISASSATNRIDISTSHDKELTAALQRVERLEQRLDSQQMKSFEDRLDYIYKIFGGLLAALGIWTVVRDFHQRKDYKAEREFYQQRSLAFEERQEKSLTHALTISKEGATRESKFATQQHELGEKVLSNSSAMLGQQLENIKKVGDVLGLVKIIFEDQKQAQAEHVKAAKESNKANETVGEFAKGFKKKYEQSAKLLKSTVPASAMDWPTLPEDDKNRARRARNSLDAVMFFVALEEEQNHPHEFAKILQLMGTSAFYDNEIDSALDFLKQSDEVYARHPMLPDYIMPRAFTKHFLAVCEKNWRVVGAPEESNFKIAEQLSAAAYDASKTKPDQFLIPITLVEIRSYITGGTSREDAMKLLEEILLRLQGIKDLNTNQRNLRVRAYLLKGNLLFYDKKNAEASQCYENAVKEDINKRNPYPPLLLAQLNQNPLKTQDNWREGLRLLEDPKSGALQKRELTTKVTALAWAILSAQALKDNQKQTRYRQELETIKITHVSDPPRVPLFFSPISKVFVDMETLKKELNSSVT